MREKFSGPFHRYIYQLAILYSLASGGTDNKLRTFSFVLTFLESCIIQAKCYANSIDSQVYVCGSNKSAVWGGTQMFKVYHVFCFSKSPL